MCLHYRPQHAAPAITTKHHCSVPPSRSGLRNRLPPPDFAFALSAFALSALARRPPLRSAMNIISPASPAALRLAPNTSKAATVFLSHVRRTFQRFPTDFTGELVRLLDDIAVVTRSIASSITSASPMTQSSATAHLYAALKSDGYACLILAKGTTQPLTFAADVPHGNYVVCIAPLDYDDTSPIPAPHTLSGTVFSVFKRRSSASLPGRGIDLRQDLTSQAAAGYCCYGSATTLHYTMGHGTHSFVLQPVSLQYFLQPATRVTIPDSASSYLPREILLRDPGASPLAAALQRAESRFHGQNFTTGGLVGDVHMLLQTGGVLVREKVHLLCEAGPIAMVVEQAGGAALTATGKRILDLKVEDDPNVSITIVAGSKALVGGLGLMEQKDANGKMSESAEAIAMLDAE